MSMIRKIIPVSLYDIPGLEGWLEEQASQGLFPTSLGSWAVFEDRGLPGTRFRLDPFANRVGELSTTAMAAASRSRGTIKAGTSFIPAFTAARNRLCPDTISYSSAVFSFGRTINGDKIPCS